MAEPLRATGAMLKSIPFFDCLEGYEREAMASLMHLESRPKGTELAGKTPEEFKAYSDTVYFLYRGVADLYTATSDGSRKILFFLGAGSLLNQNVLGLQHTNVRIHALTEVLLLCCPRAAFLERVTSSRGLTEALLKAYESRLWRLSHQMKNTAGFVSVERKLAIKLAKLLQDFGRETPRGRQVGFDITITQMADHVGIPRETMSRACKRLAEQGLVIYENKRFLIPDEAALRKFCHHHAEE